MAEKPFVPNPEDIDDFLSESSVYLDESEPLLVGMRGSSGPILNESIHSLFRVYHSIKGVAGFLHFNQIQSITHRSEEILDAARSGKSVLSEAQIDGLIRSIDVLRLLLQGVREKKSDQVHQQEVEGLLSTLSGLIQKKNDSNTGGSGHLRISALDKDICLDAFLDRPLLDKVFLEAGALIGIAQEHFLVLLDQPNSRDRMASLAGLFRKIGHNFGFIGFSQVATLAGAAEDHLAARIGRDDAVIDAAAVAKALDILPKLWGDAEIIPDPEMQELLQKLLQPTERIAGIGQKDNAIPPESRPVDTGLHANANRGEAEKASHRTQKTAEMRVSLDKLDALVTLIEELGVVAAGVSQCVATSLMPSRTIESRLLNVTESLQELSIAVRQVPAGNILRKMLRVVADVSQKMGKKVELGLHGEEVEMDREVLEALQDPLVHVVRNALDHGLETTEMRIAAGKSEIGMLKIEAWHGNGEFCLQVSDDGRGIDRKVVLDKALEKGLIQEDAREWSDQRVFQLLLQPGFSTAKSVTEFSGRGVGMDVVSKTIEDLKGRIEIHSRLGKGSSFLFRLPMANALTESLLVLVGKLRYVLRLSSVRETFHVKPGKCFALPCGQSHVKLRGTHYPVATATEGGLDDHKGLFVLLENRGRVFALAIDEVLGKIQSVIKAKPSFLKASAKVSGYAIVGTGSDDVAWSLDLDAFITDSESVESIEERV